MLFTDIEGSTRLLQDHGRGSPTCWPSTVACCGQQRSVTAVSRSGSEGDAYFFAFTAARDAAAAARDAQAALAERPDAGVAWGSTSASPRSTKIDYVGIDVNRAARICAAAHGGQVVLSERTRALLGDAFDCVPLGVHRLKDLREREKLFQLGTARLPSAAIAQRVEPAGAAVAARRPPRRAERDPAAPARAPAGDADGSGRRGQDRLALEAAAQCSDEFDDGVWWSPLAAVSEPDLVLPTVAQTLGARAPLAEHIDERRMLILLDNLEQVVDCAPAVSALLAACPDLTLLATSRTPLRLRAEREYPVPPLELDDAVELFVARAVRSDPFAVVRAICARVDALPLAVELAAARTRVFAPAELLDRLDRRLAVLTEGPVDAPDRQVTLRATIEWSYELLDPDEAEHFARLSVFGGSFDSAAALAVCETRPRCARVARSSRACWRGPQSGRFFMLETIREFAAERLGHDPELRLRHAEHYLEVARSAGLTDDSRGAMRHDLIVRDRDNVRAALDWALDSGAVEIGLRLAASLENYWVTNAPAEGAERLRGLLARRAGLAAAGAARARAAGLRGRLGNGRRPCRAVATPTSSRSTSTAATTTSAASGSCSAGSRRPRWTRARSTARVELTEESSRLVDETGFVRGQAIAAQLFAGVARAGGRSRSRRAAAGAQRRARGRRGVHLVAGRDAARACRPRARARPYRRRASNNARESLAPLAKVGDRQNVLFALALLARVAAQDGREARAGRLWGAIEAEEARGPIGAWERDRDRSCAPRARGGWRRIRFRSRRGQGAGARRRDRVCCRAADAG